MCDLMSHWFLLLHLRHTCVPLKLWVICTISVFQNIKAMEGRRSKIENGKAKNYGWLLASFVDRIGDLYIF